jgi:hypothetical protein
MTLCVETKTYAEATFITMEQAEIRCEHFKKISQEMHEARKCPKCGKHTLAIESEASTSDYVYCENDEIPVNEDGEEYFTDCDYSTIATSKHKAVSHWHDFDVVLAFASNIDSEGLPGIEKQVGCSWSEFVDDDNRKLMEGK